MAELEIHHETHSVDTVGRRIGVLAAILAVLLAVVTILSHRAHTGAILLKSEANDAWQYYQSSRIKYHDLELGEDLIHTLGSHNEATEQALGRYGAAKVKYEQQGKKLQEQAREKDEHAEHVEKQALRFDIGEGLLEIGLVLTSLYFISRKMMFPMLGGTAGICGLLVALSGWLV